jgi:sRNA-binding regulator protein Hfq
MKSGQESSAARRAPEKDEFVSRKLIRPTLAAAQEPNAESGNGGAHVAERGPRTERRERLPRKSFVPEQTFAENFYFQKQLQTKTLLTLVLKNGETINGTVDWYDKSCVKLTRAGKPSLLLYKTGIRYIYKSSEDVRGH